MHRLKEGCYIRGLQVSDLAIEEMLEKSDDMLTRVLFAMHIYAK